MSENQIIQWRKIEAWLEAQKVERRNRRTRRQHDEVFRAA